MKIGVDSHQCDGCGASREYGQVAPDGRPWIATKDGNDYCPGCYVPAPSGQALDRMRSETGYAPDWHAIREGTAPPHEMGELTVIIGRSHPDATADARRYEAKGFTVLWRPR